MDTLKPYGLSVKAVVRNTDGCCLVLRRSRSSKIDPGAWDLPGGKVDPGETFDDALRREVYEETGMRVALKKLAGASETEVRGKRIVHLFMEAVPVGGELQLSEEHDDARWISVRDLASGDLTSQLREFAEAYSATA